MMNMAMEAMGVIRARVLALALAFAVAFAVGAVPYSVQVCWAEVVSSPSQSADSASSVSQSEDPVAVDGESNLVDPTQRADNSFIYDTTVESLFEQPSIYDEKIVQVSGEAIGDIVVEDPLRAKNQWLTLTSTDSGNSSTISLLLSNDQAAQIDHLGRYGVTGTMLQARGVYHQACKDHEGIPDVHVSSINVIARGVEHPDRFSIDLFIPGVIAIGLGLVLMGAYYFVRERTR